MFTALRDIKSLAGTLTLVLLLSSAAPLVQHLCMAQSETAEHCDTVPAAPVEMPNCPYDAQPFATGLCCDDEAQGVTSAAVVLPPPTAHAWLVPAPTTDFAPPPPRRATSPFLTDTSPPPLPAALHLVHGVFLL